MGTASSRFMQAVYEGDLQAASSWLNRSPGLIQQRRMYVAQPTVWHVVAHSGNAALLELLLRHVRHMYGKRGVTCISPTLLDTANYKGQTPLMLACRAGQVSVVKLLLEAGANVHLADGKRGMTALHYASKFGQPLCIEVLLTHIYSQRSNASEQDRRQLINAQSKCGLTALHYATASNCLHAVQALLEHDADIIAKTKVACSENGAQLPAKSTPYHVAAVKASEEIVALLLKHHANQDPLTRSSDPRRMADADYMLPFQLARACNRHARILEMLRPAGDISGRFAATRGQWQPADSPPQLPKLADLTAQALQSKLKADLFYVRLASKHALPEAATNSPKQLHQSSPVSNMQAHPHALHNSFQAALFLSNPTATKALRDSSEFAEDRWGPTDAKGARGAVNLLDTSESLDSRPSYASAPPAVAATAALANEVVCIEMRLVRRCQSQFVGQPPGGQQRSTAASKPKHSLSLGKACGMCFESAHAAHIVDCGHALCMQCAEEVNSRVSAAGPATCPFCGAVVTAFKKSCVLKL